MDLSVIIPIYNEEANLPALYQRLRQTLQEQTIIRFELVFVNDGSTDNSLTLIKQYATQDNTVRYIDLSRNFGQQIAISAGLDKALGQAVVILDGDLQDPPELIPALYARLHQG